MREEIDCERQKIPDQKKNSNLEIRKFILAHTKFLSRDISIIKLAIFTLGKTNDRSSSRTWFTRVFTQHGGEDNIIDVS